MDHLDELEAQSIYILREGFARLKRLAMLWSLGKDSNVMIWLARKALFGKVPFPCLHVDTQKNSRRCMPSGITIRRNGASIFGSISARRSRTSTRHRRPRPAPPRARPRGSSSRSPNTAFGLIAGIRRDEEVTRAKEHVLSPRGTEGGWDVRDQPPEFRDHFNASVPKGAHLRIHPILH
jgi:sulfate adenylyltransferase subunit 2